MDNNYMLKKNLFLLLLFLLAINFNKSNCQSDDNLKKQVVRLGALGNIIDGVDVKDADAAFKILTDSFLKRLKNKKIYNFDFGGQIYPDLKTLKKDVDNKEINFFNVSTIEYFDLIDRANFKPFLSGTNDPDNKFDIYLLITNNKNQINDINQLKNVSISIPKRIENNIGAYWLKATLREALGKIDYKSLTFLTSKQSDSEAMLSVFFGKSTYVLISESSFNLGCELNPSLKSKIKILKKSGQLLNGVFAFRVGSDPTTVKAITDVALDIHKDVEGKQILNLFKIQRIISITESDLLESNKVINKYNKYFK